MLWVFVETQVEEGQKASVLAEKQESRFVFNSIDNEFKSNHKPNRILPNP